MLEGPKYRVSFGPGTMILESRIPTSLVLACPHDPIDSDDLNTLSVIPDRPFGQPDGDQRIWMMIRRIAALVPVHVVRGLVPRGIIDYNRPLTDHKAPTDAAIYNGNGLEEWRAYHEAIEMLIAKVRGEGSKPTFWDIHGFSGNPEYGVFDVLIGTHYGETVYDPTLVDQIATALRTRYRVFVPGTQPQIPGQLDLNDGGYSVQYVAAAMGCDAVQLEHAKMFRDPAGPEKADEIAAIYADLITDINQAQVHRW